MSQKQHEIVMADGLCPHFLSATRKIRSGFDICIELDRKGDSQLMTKRVRRKPNFLLRRVREWHSLSQQEVAEFIGTTALSVSRWERGLVLLGPNFRRALCALFKKNPYELGFISAEDADMDSSTDVVERMISFQKAQAGSEPDTTGCR